MALGFLSRTKQQERVAVAGTEVTRLQGTLTKSMQGFLEEQLRPLMDKADNRANSVSRQIRLTVGDFPELSQIAAKQGDSDEGIHAGVKAFAEDLRSNHNLDVDVSDFSWFHSGNGKGYDLTVTVGWGGEQQRPSDIPMPTAPVRYSGD